MRYPKDIRCIGKTNIEQVQLVVYRMLKILDQICKKHDIDYWLDYGTLLGAVRHKGFIPWDNEADIGMMRDDYDRFLQIVDLELPRDLFFQTAITDPNYVFSYLIEGKLRDRYSNYIEFANENPQCNWHNGIQLDFFVYDLDEHVENGITNSFERYISKRKIFLAVSEIEYTIPCQFMDSQFPIPIGYDAYLKRNYGNYLEYPPVEEQRAPLTDMFNPCNHPESLLWTNETS
jgi:lipopolysaccharide cholinephosphotransferase